MNLEIDDLKNNPNAKVVVKYWGGEQVVGFITQNLTVGGASEFNNPFESAMAESATSLINKAIATGNSLMGMNKSQLSLKSLEQTVSTWSGSKKPDFQIEILLLAYRNPSTVIADAKKLLRCVYPKKAGLVVEAPLGYTGHFNSPGGTVSVYIGKWFRAWNQIVTSVNVEFSKEVISDGTPLYARCDFHFEPWRLPDWGTVASYIGLKG